MEQKIKTKTFAMTNRSQGEAEIRLEGKVLNFMSERGPGFCRRLVEEGSVNTSVDREWYTVSKTISYEEIEFVQGSYFDKIISAQ